MTNIRYDIYKCKDMHAGTHTQVLFPNGNQNSCIEICCLHNGGWIGTCREFSNYLQPSFKAWPLAGISLGAWPRPAYISMFTTLASSFFCCKTSTYLPLRLRLGYFLKPCRQARSSHHQIVVWIWFWFVKLNKNENKY